MHACIVHEKADQCHCLTLMCVGHSTTIFKGSQAAVIPFCARGWQHQQEVALQGIMTAILYSLLMSSLHMSDLSLRRIFHLLGLPCRLLLHRACLPEPNSSSKRLHQPLHLQVQALYTLGKGGCIKAGTQEPSGQKEEKEG